MISGLRLQASLMVRGTSRDIIASLADGAELPHAIMQMRYQTISCEKFSFDRIGKSVRAGLRIYVPNVLKRTSKNQSLLINPKSLTIAQHLSALGTKVQTKIA